MIYEWVTMPSSFHESTLTIFLSQILITYSVTPSYYLEHPQLRALPAQWPELHLTLHGYFVSICIYLHYN